MSSKRIVVSVINDLSFDQRVKKVCDSLHENGFEIVLIGRKLKESGFIERKYKTVRMKLFFTKGPFFYAEFNFRLFFKLLFMRVDAFHANDLDTLLANYLASKVRRKPLIYDTHEYFLGVPEIQHKKVVLRIWRLIESRIFPKLKHVFTVNLSIANLYEKDYGFRPQVVRNIPKSSQLNITKTKVQLELPLDRKIVILQGAGINIDRGSEELLEAVALDDRLFLVVVGGGDVIEQLMIRGGRADLYGRVKFVGKVDYAEMMQYTANAHIGVTLDKDTNLNYRYSLPNKIFDYFKAGIPVLASNLVEVKKIIDSTAAGVIVESHDPKIICNSLVDLLFGDEYDKFKNNARVAGAQFRWENEILPMIRSYNDIFQYSKK